MKIKDRKTAKVIKEEEDSASVIKFLYHSLLGRAVLKFIFPEFIFQSCFQYTIKVLCQRKR